MCNAAAHKTRAAVYFLRAIYLLFFFLGFLLHFPTDRVHASGHIDYFSLKTHKKKRSKNPKPSLACAPLCAQWQQQIKLRCCKISTTFAGGGGGVVGFFFLLFCTHSEPIHTHTVGATCNWNYYKIYKSWFVAFLCTALRETTTRRRGLCNNKSRKSLICADLGVHLAVEQTADVVWWLWWAKNLEFCPKLQGNPWIFGKMQNNFGKVHFRENWPPWRTNFTRTHCSKA